MLILLTVSALVCGGALGWLLAHWKLTAPKEPPRVPNPETMTFYADKMLAFQELHGLTPTNIFVSPTGMKCIQMFTQYQPTSPYLQICGMRVNVKRGVPFMRPMLWHEALDPSVERFYVEGGPSEPSHRP